MDKKVQNMDFLFSILSNTLCRIVLFLLLVEIKDFRDSKLFLRLVENNGPFPKRCAVRVAGIIRMPVLPPCWSPNLGR